jgi:hypothetical protein
MVARLVSASRLFLAQAGEPATAAATTAKPAIWITNIAVRFIVFLLRGLRGEIDFARSAPKGRCTEDELDLD